MGDGLHEYGDTIEKRRNIGRRDEDDDCSLDGWKEKKNKDRDRNDDRRDDRKNNRYDNRRDDRRDTKYDNNKRDTNSYDDNRGKEGNRTITLIEAATKRFIDMKRNPVNELEEFARRLSGFKYGEKLTNAFRSMDNNGGLDEIGPVVGAMIFEIMNANRPKFKGDLEDNYIGMIDKLVKPRVAELSEKMKKRHRPSKSILREIAIVLPTDDIIDPDKNIYSIVNMLNDKLYGEATEWFKHEKDEEPSEDTKFTAKGIRKLYEAVYGEANLPKVAIGCLLEKRDKYNKMETKEAKALWNAITEFSLDTLNEMEDKKEFEEMEKLLENYTTMRTEDFNDAGRRVILRDVDEDEYKTLSKVVKRLCRNEKFAGRLT